MTTKWDIGDAVILQAIFKTSDGTLTNPTTTTLYIRDPSGNVTTVANGSLSTPSTGTKTYTLTLDEAGTWWYRFTGTGAVVASEEGSLIVRGRNVVP